MNSKNQIKNIFVLMLENRSYDHMLGFSNITGIDAKTGQQTVAEGLSGNESNTYKGNTYQVTQPADYIMPYDPGHEFSDTVTQLCGLGTTYKAKSAYPNIDSSGFVADYATTKSSGEGGATSNFGEIMKCYSPSQLPVMNALAKEFALCDHWFSAIPGPTWPNRFFAMAASSSGLDSSPSSEQIAEWETVHGFSFKNGNLFDLVNKANAFGARIYKGNDGPLAGSIPIAAALKGQTILDMQDYSNFALDVNSQSYPYPFTFIEPNYGNILNNSYSGGTSQHPMDDVRNGEKLIKATYEAIRNSPHWNNSLLIITYDEHGGFYDHVAPPTTIAPGDDIYTKYNKNEFNFEQLGVRVPAIVVSPLIPKNTIDHTIYQHSSIPSTVESIMGLNHLTDRDKNANDLTSLLSLSSPRTDAPKTLPDPIEIVEDFSLKRAKTNPQELLPSHGNVRGFLQILLKEQLYAAPENQHDLIIEDFNKIKTVGEAESYIHMMHNQLFKN